MGILFPKLEKTVLYGFIPCLVFSLVYINNVIEINYIDNQVVKINITLLS